MAFDFQEQFKKAVRNMKEKMDRYGVKSIYTMLCVSALWPVVEATKQGDWSGLVALGAFVGGLGSNLIANEIQRWKDEADGAKKLALVISDKSYQKELDAIVLKLNAINLARESLSDSDKNWFNDTLLKELGRLGNINNFNNSFEGVNVASIVGDDNIVTQNSYMGNIYFSGGINIVQSNNSVKKIFSEDDFSKYLDYVIDSNQNLQLQGIRAGSQPVNVNLENVFISLNAMDVQVTSNANYSEKDVQINRDTGNFSIAEILKKSKKLVVIGDPGSGKTTLFSYIAITYARTIKEKINYLKERFDLDEKDIIPILIPLRNFGHYILKNNPYPESDGPQLLIDYLSKFFEAQTLFFPKSTLEIILTKSKAIVLLDGMDEVADTNLRTRIARIIEAFAGRFPDNRYVVSSRIIGYSGASRIGSGFHLVKIRDFTNENVNQFVFNWTKSVEINLAGKETPYVMRLANVQAQDLLKAITENERISELAVNPLLLTVIALVHRYRAQLPERRSELYEEAIEVLLAYWDEAKGLNTDFNIENIKLDAGDRRSLLEPVALWLHINQKREIEVEDLKKVLFPSFKTLLPSSNLLATKALDKFISLINERTGLFVERGVNQYSFTHLTFQEYLAARALADNNEQYIKFVLTHLNDAWWREVILLEAGYLSTQGKRRVSELINAIINSPEKTDDNIMHNLKFATECLLDVGNARVEGNLLGDIRKRLEIIINTPIQNYSKTYIIRRITASSLLGRIELGQFDSRYYKSAWGEPIWVNIPSGSYHKKPIDKVLVNEFMISRFPITNQQYFMFCQDTNLNDVPKYWGSYKPPKGIEYHPVVNVSIFDACNYCIWLSKKTGHVIRLPYEEEWEKTARGAEDSRRFPWGNNWQEYQCNSIELEIENTTPVDVFWNSASPFGVVDMCGNVLEWTLTKEDGENKNFSSMFQKRAKEEYGNYILKGGAFLHYKHIVTINSRIQESGNLKEYYIGFRVVKL